MRDGFPAILNTTTNAASFPWPGASPRQAVGKMFLGCNYRFTLIRGDFKKRCSDR